MTYEVIPRAYLARARAALQRGTPDDLFYAAFELRCCVEARQAEYAEALAAYEGTKIRPWNLGETGKRIRRQSNASTIAMVAFKFPDGTSYASYHTPVTDDLIGFAERTLHALMHCQTTFRVANDPWWERTRDELTTGYRMAWLACQGDSMVPPLWNAETKQLHPSRIEVRENNRHLFELMDRHRGQVIELNVDYPAAHPTDWACDL